MQKIDTRVVKDGIQSLIDDGVIERMPDGRIRVTQATWDLMTTYPEVAHSEPKTLQPPHPRKPTHGKP